MPGFAIRVGTKAVFFCWFAIDPEFCYEFLPAPSRAALLEKTLQNAWKSSASC
jgi:hypothetical protein